MVSWHKMFKIIYCKTPVTVWQQVFILSQTLYHICIFSKKCSGEEHLNTSPLHIIYVEKKRYTHMKVMYTLMYLHMHLNHHVTNTKYIRNSHTHTHTQTNTHQALNPNQAIFLLTVSFKRRQSEHV